MAVAVAVLLCGRGRPNARRHTRDACCGLARAEDFGKRDCLEGETLGCGNTLKQCHTFPGLLGLFHIRNQQLRSTAKDDLVAVIVVVEQSELI
jgi:hypothetical protein